VHLIASAFVVLAVTDAELLELVDGPAFDVQNFGVLGHAMEKRWTVSEFEVVKQRVQGADSADYAVEVQRATKGGVVELAAGTKDLLALGEVDLRGILIAEPFAPADAVVVVEPAVVRDHALRVKRGMEVLTGVGDQWG